MLIHNMLIIIILRITLNILHLHVNKEEHIFKMIKNHMNVFITVQEYMQLHTIKIIKFVINHVHL